MNAFAKKVVQLGNPFALYNVFKLVCKNGETNVKEKDVIPNLMSGFDLDESQAEFIAEIKLRNLNREYITHRIEEVEALQKEIAELEGKLASITMELPEDGRLNADELKRLTGNDLISARKLRQGLHKFLPTAQIIIVGNELPSFYKHDSGIIRRLLVFHFNIEHAKRIKDKQYKDLYKGVPGDSAKLSELIASEAPAIIRLLAEKYIELKQKYNLNIPISQECENAKNEDIKFNTEKRNTTTAHVQSYFVDQIIEELIDDLVEKCGYSENVALRTIYSGGLKIYATVDPKIQTAMDKIFEDPSKFPNYSGKVQPECAMILLDPENGDVLGMRGGRGKKAGARVLNRATQSKRPPGSSIKPIAVYAPAIEYGLITPFSVEDDAPISILNGSAYPKNETRTYSGRTTINEAVKQSINTISMRTLEKLSIDRSYNFLTANLGVTSLSKNGDKNLAPLALGQLTNGITVLEMAAAYAPFANGGTYYEPRTYTKVLDASGDVLLEKEGKPTKAMSEKTATYMSYMLQNVVSSGTGTYAQLKNSVPAAAKTGTSNNDEDRWFVGYTPYYVGAVWFGYDTPKYISKSLSPALTTWENVMNEIHKGLPAKTFPKNDDFKYVDICSISGDLATENCKLDPRGSRIVAGYFHKDDAPKKACDAHVLVDIDTTTNMLASEFCPAENRKTVALMNIARTFPISGVVVPDEQYAFHDDEPTDGQFYFSSGAEKPMNSVCTAHTYTPPTVEEPEVNSDDTGNLEHPENGEFSPDEQGNSGISDENSDAGNIFDDNTGASDNEQAPQTE